MPRLVFCQELDEKIDTSLMSVRKYDWNQQLFSLA